jgi:hypothetical protein
MDIKQDLRDRITRLIANSNSPVASLNFSARDIDHKELTKLMEELTVECQANCTNITYDCASDVCLVTVSNSPGRQCAIDYSIRRFKRSYMPPMAMF